VTRKGKRWRKSEETSVKEEAVERWGPCWGSSTRELFPIRKKQEDR